MNELFLKSLAAVQGEIPTLQRDSVNPHFGSKYISLESLMEQVLPILRKHGLIWVTMPSGTPEAPTLKYALLHDGCAEDLAGEMPLLPAKSDPQALGSAITYARRYALMAVLGLVADEDDDGNGGTEQGHTAVDAARPAATKIPADRAKAILAKAIEVGHAKEEDGKVALSATLKAKLELVGVSSKKIGHLNVDQAEDVEAFLSQEAAS